LDHPHLVADPVVMVDHQLQLQSMTFPSEVVRATG
jgi:hypothetical protein